MTGKEGIGTATFLFTRWGIKEARAAGKRPTRKKQTEMEQPDGL